MFLLTIIITLIVVGGAVVAFLNRSGVKKEILRTRQHQLSTAEQSLRSIASGSSGNPQLEAQIALDNIGNDYNKELS
jgi:hypothetical protein